VIGGIVTVVGIYGWAMEPPDDPDLAHGHDDPHDDDEATAAELVAPPADAAVGAATVSAGEVESVV
jgi:hypothetical protein